MRLIALLLSLCFAAFPAAAQDAAPAPTLSIGLGEIVTARVTPEGRFIELSRAQGEGQGERAADTVRFTFSNMGGQRMLRVENGYGRAFVYRARAFVRGGSANTSICPVMPRIMGMEIWGDPIDRLELREPRLFEAGPSMTCE
jgi:hypothetical protein